MAVIFFGPNVLKLNVLSSTRRCSYDIAHLIRWLFFKMEIKSAENSNVINKSKGKKAGRIRKLYFKSVQ